MSDGNSKPESLNPLIRREAVGSLKGIAETDNGLPQYSRSLGFWDEDKLIDYIKGKKVLDVGSGKGGLAKDCALKGIDARIYSLNPRLGDEKGREEEKKETSTYHGTPEQVNQIQKAHDAFAMAGLAQELPYLDNSLGVILDHYALTYYYHPEFGERELLKTAYKEYYRVLEPGGKVRAGPVSPTARIDRIEAIETVARETGFEVKEIKDPDGHEVVAFELTKLK